jgi:hypothetical protein
MTRLFPAPLDSLTPLSLEDLNARAAMMERLDQKYVVTADQLARALDRLADRFDVLEIGGQRAFGYATRYFDDPDLRSYHDHHQGRRLRSKVRVRRYLDAGLTYLEVKLKTLRDVTVKKRMALPTMPDALDCAAMAFVDACHRDLYGAPLGRVLVPGLSMRYTRATLVARDGGERMTIDGGLVFGTAGQARPVRPDLFILETKSALGRGLADAVLRDLHLKPTPRLSKYCIGLAAVGGVARRNRFLPGLRRLDLLGRPQGVASPGTSGYAPPSFPLVTEPAQPLVDGWREGERPVR